MNFEELTLKKSNLDKLKPFNQKVINYLDEWFKIELTYSSNAIEGNSLTRNNTGMIIEKDAVINRKPLSDHLAAINHVYALEFIKKQINRNPWDIEEDDIEKIHDALLGINARSNNRVKKNTDKSGGIKIGFALPKLILWKLKIDKLNPVELSCEAYFHFLKTIPCKRFNGQVGRLLMNMLLVMQGYPPVVISKQDHDKCIDGVTGALKKKEYLGVIERSLHKSLDICTNVAKHGVPRNSSKQFLRIGEVAKEVGLRNSAIRHWTKEGLIDISKVTDAGYQIYASDVIVRINKIKELKEKRLTLDEIKERL